VKSLSTNDLKRIGGTGALLLRMAVGSPAWAKHPHYTSILPDKYVGWVQIIFNDPQAPRLRFRKDKGYEITIPESGVARTSDWRVHAGRPKDEFYYRLVLPGGTADVRLVPSGYVMSGDSHGGFGVMDTGGKGPGYSWFIFIGPPELRAGVPLADWDKVVEEYSKTHAGQTKIPAADTYPEPGRMPSAVQMQP
jgi:hypothetical protein